MAIIHIKNNIKFKEIVWRLYLSSIGYYPEMTAIDYIQKPKRSNDNEEK